MSFVAILNARSKLDELLAAGDRPAAVATWSSAVAHAARGYGIPVLEEDEYIAQADRLAIHDRAEDLVRALCGDTVPTSDDYADWCWWALEFPFYFAFSHGARTLQMLKGLRELAPDYVAVAHDREGYMQGAVTNFLVSALGFPTFGFAPHTSLRETLHQRIDAFAVPMNREAVRVGWQGKPLPRDGRPAVAMIHTNEVAQLTPHFASLGQPHFVLCEDARYPWPKGYIGPRLDARHTGEVDGLIEPRWPEHLAMETAIWERKLAETIAITYQPALREERAWVRAAYAAGHVEALIGGGTWFHDVRARVLACRDLGIPVILVQHGMLAERSGGRGERVQHFAEYQMEWSRTAAADLDKWGASGEKIVIGWPQASTDRALQARATQKALAAEPPVPDDRPWVILTSSPLPDEPYAWGERFLQDALEALAAVDPGRRVLIKHHPFQEPPEIIRQLCDEWGFPDVEIVGGLDPWLACERARGVIAFKSTSVHCALQVGVPVVVYHPSAHDAMFERFPGFPVARTPAALREVLASGFAGADYAAARTYARADTHAGVRAVAALRRILHGTRAERLAAASPAEGLIPA